MFRAVLPRLMSVRFVSCRKELRLISHKLKAGFQALAAQPIFLFPNSVHRLISSVSTSHRPFSKTRLSLTLTAMASTSPVCRTVNSLTLMAMAQSIKPHGSAAMTHFLPLIAIKTAKSITAQNCLVIKTGPQTALPNWPNLMTIRTERSMPMTSFSVR